MCIRKHKTLGGVTMINVTRKTMPFVAFLYLLCPHNVHATPLIPTFNTSDFSADQLVNNSYFPIYDGLVRVFEGKGVDDEGEAFTERFELSGQGFGPDILGIQTTTQRDRAFEDGLLVEDTLDYYAQDNSGNVWYMGEDVINYIYDDDDNLLTTNSSSSWRAGVNDAKPGWIMPVDLTVGLNYYQEFAPQDGALDEATTNMTDMSLSLAIGDFNNVLRVLETNPSGELEFKYYAPGVGLVMVEEGLNDQLGNPELTVEYTGAQPVPEPTTMMLFGTGLLSLSAAGRYRKKAGC